MMRWWKPWQALVPRFGSGLIQQQLSQQRCSSFVMWLICRGRMVSLSCPMCTTGKAQLLVL
jgi:hypothetical protein